MSEYARSLDSLAEFFREQGRNDPLGVVSEVVTVLENCLISNPNSKILSVILEPNEFLGVQQFVNKFGCHLKRGYTFLNGRAEYSIEQNW